MFKSMKSILIALTLAIIVIFLTIGLPILLTSPINFKNINHSKTVNISKLNEDYLQITENLIVDVNDDDTNSLFFPISIYKDYQDGYVEMIDTKITVNNQKILKEYEKKINPLKNIKEEQNINDNIVYNYTANYMRIFVKNINHFSPGRYTITINYKCSINDVINEYNNVSVLKIRRNTKFEPLIINLTLPKYSETFNVNSNKAITNTTKNNTYKTDLSKVYSTDKFEYVGFVFDKKIFSNASIINTNYEIGKETNIFANEDITNIIYFFVIAIITIILLVIGLLLTKKVKLKKDYIRDPKLVISPILAETLIDSKMRF